MKGLRIAAAAAGGAYLLLFAIVVFARARYPFELEWMEGETLEHVRRVVRGAPLYVTPSLDFVPFGYPPLYYYLCALVSVVVGETFLALRIVSIAAAIGSFALIFLIVRRESGPWPGFIGASLLAATYAQSGAWLDLGRVDALYLFFALAAWSFLTRSASRFDCIAAACCLLLAFATKQPIVLSLLPLAVYLAAREPRRLAWVAVPAIAGAVGAVLVANAISGGWYSYYVFTLPRLRLALSLDWPRSMLFWLKDLALPLWPALLLVSLGGWHLYRKNVRHLFLAAGFVGSAWLARLEGGAWTNALLPAYAAVAILFGIAVARVPSQTLAAVAALVQFVVLAYDPRPLRPSRSDADAGRHVVATISAIPGDVLVLDHGYLATMAGKRTFAHGWALTDVMWADYHGVGQALEASVRARLESDELAAVVLDDTPHWFTPVIEASYPRTTAIFSGVDAFRPRSGAPRRPFVIRTR